MKNCQTAHGLVDRVFLLDELDRDEALMLRGHLRSCSACQRYYERAMILARLLESNGGAATEPSATEIGWFGAGAAQSPRPSAPLVWSAWLRRAAWVLIPAAVVVGAVLVRTPTEPTLVPRSGTTPPLAIRAFCRIAPVGMAPTIRPLAANPGPQETRACPKDAMALFAFKSDRPGFLFAFQVMSNADTNWLLPATPSEQGWAIEAKPDWTTLPFHLPLAQLDGPSTRVVFVLSEQELTMDRIEAAFRSTPDRKSLAAQLKVFVVEREVLVEGRHSPGP